MATAENSSVVRFGLFELDLQARELRKSGIRIKLQDQPFQILASLLERPGEIVTREELQKRLWPADTFVDFDLSLNSAVKKLRQALNDDSDNPRFIETLYRRGYRFIGPVNGNSKVNGTALTESVADQHIPPVPLPALTVADSPKPALRSKKLLGLAVVLVLLVLAGASWLARPGPIRVLGYTQITHDARVKAGIVTDGQRLYFQEFDGDHVGVAQVSASGGETDVLPSPFPNVGIGDISPDGSALLVSNVKEATPALWNLPLPAGAPRRISDLPPNSAAWSPDGSEIAFSKGPEIYLAKPDGTGSHKLATTHGIVTGLRFSPDGRMLRFAVTDSENASQVLWEIKRDGSSQHQLLPGWNSTFQCCGNWTRDGKYYVFQSSTRSSVNIWALSDKSRWFSRSPKPVQLTNGPLEFSFPVPSKDGKKIFLLGSQPRAEVLRFDPKLGLVPYLGGVSAIDLTFSPDGQWVAYVSIPDFTLWRSRTDGSSPLQLTSSSMYAELPRWSPDGKHIVFMGRTEKTNFRAYLVSADAGDLRELIPGSEKGFDPGWLSDGKSIILGLSDMDSPESPGISILDLESNKISPLPGSEKLFSPRPSPDGKYIAAIAKNSEELFLFDVATRKWTELIKRSVGPIGYPNWSHDGQYLYFDTVFSEDPGIFRIRVTDGKLEKVLALKGVRRFHANFGAWSGLAPDDSPLLARDLSNQEIYALDWEAH